MAAKKSGKVGVGSAGAFDVAKVLASADARRRAVAALVEVEQTGVVAEVTRMVQAERGVWIRQGHTWPASVRKLCERAFARADLLQDVMHERHASRTMVGDCEASKATSDRLWQLVGALLEASLEVMPTSPTESEATAGLSGYASVLGQLRSGSGVEAARTLAMCIRRAVVGMDNPFWPYLATSAVRKAMAKQTNRTRPGSARDLLPDDVAILKAVRAGASLTKEVAAASEEHGKAVGVSHVSKRKSDLKKWGLLTLARSFELTDKGREWLVTVDNAGAADR